VLLRARLGAVAAYRFSNLTSAIADRRSPLRRYLDEHFPHVRAVQRAYREPPRQLLVRGGPSDPAAIGAAYDLGVRFVIDPAHSPSIALYGFVTEPRLLAVVDAVVSRAQSAAAHQDDPEARDDLARACWALAWCTDVYRSGGIRPESPLAPLLATGSFTPHALLGLAGPDARRQLEELAALSRQHLLPHLRRPVALGPTFEASALCAADADLIAGQLLVDLKTRLGPKDKETGRRSDRLRTADLYQLLAYVLFDRDDRFSIDSVGIYSARYAALTTWPLQQLLDDLAGRTVDLPRARQQVWELLGGSR
jgi:hypothetical protein